MHSRSALLIVATLVTISAAVPAQAQLVHLAFEAPAKTGAYKLSGDRPSVYPWDTSGMGSLPALLQLDIYYDLASPQSGANEFSATYSPLDPSRNFGRVRLDDPKVGQPFDFTVSIDRITVQDHALYLTGMVPPGWEYPPFEVTLGFASALGDLSLPQPPLPAFDPQFLPHLYLEGDAALFGLEHLAGGIIIAGFDNVRAELITDFTAVPEASTYGLMAALTALACVVIRSGRRLARLAAPDRAHF
jgi:hypothetical protein